MNCTRFFTIGILISLLALKGFSQEPSRMEFLMSANTKPRPKLIIFSADWCLPCKVARKEMVENVSLKRILQDYEVVKYDFDSAKEEVKKYNITKVPTYIIESEGKEVRRQIGFGGTEKFKKFLD